MYVFPFQNLHSLHLSNLSHGVTIEVPVNQSSKIRLGRIGEWHLDWLKSLSELIQEFLELGHRDYHGLLRFLSSRKKPHANPFLGFFFHLCSDCEVSRL